MATYPWMQFYPDDWRRDLRRVPLASRGLWIDLVCEMWHSPERGVLLHANGTVIPDSDICGIVGDTPGSIRRALEKLEAVGVLSRREDDGAIYCRRMVREEEKRAGTRERVRRHRSNGEVTGDATQMKRSSNGVDTRSQKPEARTPHTPPPDGPSFMAFWHAYPAKGRTRMSDCKAVWGDAVGIAGSAAQIVSKAEEYAKSPRGSGRYCLAAHRWLEGRCWEDAPEAWQDKKETANAGRYIPQ